MTAPRLRAVIIILLAALCCTLPAAAAQQPEGGEKAESQRLGFYSYSDTETGRLNLALLPGHRFMLVVQHTDGGATGLEGWSHIEGERLFLSSGTLDLDGVFEGPVLHLDYQGAVYPLYSEAAAAAAQGEGGGEKPGVTGAAPGALPITLWYWLAATIPLAVLIFLLVGLHWSPASASAASLASAAVIALTLYEMPLHTMAVATGEAVWDAIFIMYIVWPALALYSVIKEAGAFDRIEASLQSLVDSRLLLILGVAWGFSAFIQGIVGEGVPLAITIPLMLQLRVKPIYAVLLPLIGRTWGNVFGAMGEGWLLIERAIVLPEPVMTALYSGILLWIPDLIAGLSIALIYGGWKALRRGVWAILAISTAHSGVQLVLAPFYPQVAGFAGAAAGLGVVFLLARYGPYAEQDQDCPDRIFSKKNSQAAQEREDGGNDESNSEKEVKLWAAFAPYAGLCVLSITVLMIPPIRDFLSQWALGPAFPAVSTPLGIERPAEPSYGAFQVLTHPGTLILAVTLITCVLYQQLGYFDHRSGLRIGRRAIDESLPATTPFVALVLAAKVMELSGMLLVLALGIAAVTSPAAYSFAAPWIAALGAFATDSTSGSLVIFTPVQATAAQALGVPLSVIIAGHAAGAATGNALAALDILIGLLVIGKPQLLGRVLKYTALWSLAALTVVGTGSFLLYWIVT